MNIAEFDPDELYICAGICRIDYRTNTCIGCGRPLIDTGDKSPSTQSNESSVPDLAGRLEASSPPR